MTVTAQMVKELRQRTGAGMMECKKALAATDGDIEKAIKEMRKSGQAKADKKASRLAAEGIIAIAKSDDKLTMIEVNSETDFVARDSYFKKFADEAVNRILNSEATTVDEALQLKLATGESMDMARKNLIAKIGENINLRRIASIQGDQLGEYNHGGRIGVIVTIKSGDDPLAKDIAMHIAASTPLVISQQQFPDHLVEKEKEIFTAQARQSGKPDHIIEKMITGRIHKFLDEHSLLGQPFVKNPEQTVGALLKQKNAEVINFVRFSVGEGIEKNEVDFAREVMSQLGGA